MKNISLVFRSSRDPRKFHRVDFLATDPRTVRCTCPAGRRGGKCKHIRLLSLLEDWGDMEPLLFRWKNQPGW